MSFILGMRMNSWLMSRKIACKTAGFLFLTCYINMYELFPHPLRFSNRSICSVPFKKLDKKSEKQYMFARRQELTARLAAAVEAEKVLELTVLLLLQQVNRTKDKDNCVPTFITSNQLMYFPQVKSVCAFCLSVDLLLPILCMDKKICNEVASELTSLQVVIKAGGDVAMDSELSSLIEKVRGWGLCKDISKYQVEREAREC